MNHRINRAVFSAFTVFVFTAMCIGLLAQTDGAASNAGNDGRIDQADHAVDGAKKSDERRDPPAAGAPAGKRPDHVLDASLSRFGDNETGVRVMLRDKLFSSGDTNLNNMLSFDRREFNDRHAPDMPLYAVSTMLAVQNPDYYAIGRVWSNSDKPFADSSTIGGALVGAKRVYEDGKHSIYAAVFLTTERYFSYRYPFPIPFFSYQYKNETLTVSAGVPSMVMWRITPRVSIMAIYTPVRNIEASVTFRPLPFISLSAEGIWRVDGYYLEDRREKKERLFHEYGLARIKVQSYVGRNAALYVAGGYRAVDMFFTSKRSTHREHVRECPRSLFAEFGASAFM